MNRSAALLISLIPTVFLSSQSYAADWQTPLMWEWVLATASPKLNEHEAEIANLQQQVADLEAYVTQLQAYLEIDESTDPTKPVVRVVAANFQVVSGEGTTDAAPNGVGNIIIGYDEARPSGQYWCTDGVSFNYIDCGNNNALWHYDFKLGSHNLIVGAEHSYSRYGAIIGGFQNTSTGVSTSITGGSTNTATGAYGAVVGGNGNTATDSNAAALGGRFSHASGAYATVSGGSYNIASGDYSSASGGRGNTPSGTNASISGGYNGHAGGQYGSISGGFNRTANGQYDWAGGSLFEDF